VELVTIGLNKIFDMTRLEKLNKIQSDAVEAAINFGDTSTINACVGSGKTFMAFKYIYKLREMGKIWGDSQDILIWFLAETTTREATLYEEAEKFKNIYGLDLLNDFTVEFYCYQAKPECSEPIDVIIADEIHNALTPIYKDVFFNNSYHYLLGLSGTLPLELVVNKEEEDVTKQYTKGHLLDQIAPVSFEYPLTQGIIDGVISPFETTIVNHVLDTTSKVVTDKKKGVEYKTTEQSYYSKRHSVMMTRIPRNDGRYWWKQNQIRQMCALLWNTPSKALPAKILIDKLEGKTIIFAPQLKILRSITDNVVSGENTDKQNQELIDKFNSGEIKVIASAQKLKQGITLEGVTNCIILSYYKKSWHVIQQIGRIVRFVEDKLGQVYIFRTLGTLEVKWFDNMNKIRDSRGKIKEEINLNIKDQIYTTNLLAEHGENYEAEKLKTELI